ncbi:endolytic transglycosylase MltG [Candidatus Kuenenbacteria bacterium HGW-Kuenenbacteria-1]|uniref:Endolytic murein transglycosylase n=1 Tax=Candidatus Kuenenbacteria bacterium HGW-Kuenenbacteria-1 TaxID=2013812 RepID=A0A2N1UNW5_9BACT|nr:MAG: endolytic transglycosylase MltG [Candidatus Kuenenbacteria bacterium HGW-Kuenenbacteria-1]
MQFVKVLIILIIVILLIIGIGLGNYYYQISTSVAIKALPKEFVIKKGEGVNEISQNLKDQKLIRSMWDFEVYIWQKKLGKKFQAGNYLLSSQMNIKKIVQILISGQIIPNQTTIKIIEGWNYKEIAKYLKNIFSTDKNTDSLIWEEFFFTEIYDSSWLKKYSFLADNPFLNENNRNFSKLIELRTLKNYPFAVIPLEGYLFPDTYQIYKDASEYDIIKKMLDNFDKKLSSQMREDIKKQNKTIFEIITLASIIEKEVPNNNDRKIVAGIFYKRLKEGMRLESCATINYILGNDKKQLSFEDTRVESPYNTYLNKGLPSGPISNPGLSAINAAIYPQETDYLFFLSKPTGETVFSKTLKEHNQNKRKWLKKL